MTTSALPTPAKGDAAAKQSLTFMAPASGFKRDTAQDLDEKPPSDSMFRAWMAGWTILALFFGGFGYWGLPAPVNGAVVATGMVKGEGNRKSVQHLDGGIVKELRVKEGDKVTVGDIIVLLDDTQARAESRACVSSSRTMMSPTTR